MAHKVNGRTTAYNKPVGRGVVPPSPSPPWSGGIEGGP